MITEPKVDSREADQSRERRRWGMEKGSRELLENHWAGETEC